MALLTSDDALITSYGRLVEAESNLSRQLGASLEQEIGLPHSWFEVLLRVSRADDGRIAMSALAQQVTLTTGGVTKLIDRMIAAGLVERVPCFTDRRVSFAVLTALGEETLARASVLHAANLRQAFVSLGERDRRRLDALLDRLRAARIST